MSFYCHCYQAVALSSNGLDLVGLAEIHIHLYSANIFLIFMLYLMFVASINWLSSIV
ncbi:hypothetical protein M501DRAFT_994157 [Patellaria atrata CBS 101060]|uniref:Uncharacterized protein n=1 Tax=Patellaria atrata CBS 101060 TaxID=1346257 RepID=A0A9P4VRT2_9PEZI|nr:hypothetical protein M501DRAFT_994157 [Patellaria atrata CBS 101060]